MNQHGLCDRPPIVEIVWTTDGLGHQDTSTKSNAKNISPLTKQEPNIGRCSCCATESPMPPLDRLGSRGTMGIRLPANHLDPILVLMIST
jgi:hypothetical protein